MFDALPRPGRQYRRDDDVQEDPDTDLPALDEDNETDLELTNVSPSEHGNTELLAQPI